MLHKIKWYLLSFILWLYYGKDYLHIQLYASKYKTYRNLNGAHVVSDEDGWQYFQPYDSDKWYDLDFGFEVNDDISQECERVLQKYKHNFEGIKLL